jgi:hypothetical protein
VSASPHLVVERLGTGLHRGERIGESDGVTIRQWGEKGPAERWRSRWDDVLCARVARAVLDVVDEWARTNGCTVGCLTCHCEISPPVRRAGHGKRLRLIVVASLGAAAARELSELLAARASLAAALAAGSAITVDVEGRLSADPPAVA